MIRMFAVMVAVGAGSLTLASCGGSETATPAADTSAGAEAVFNDADVTFAQGMIPHHRQATDMAALAADRTENPAILNLATRIQGAQDPEIEMMRGWLQTWGHDEMATGMEGMDHDMSGMMSDDDMAALEAVSGAEFDRLFAELMIQHHQGAIDMARTVIDDGTDPDVRDLAEAIITAQSAEITAMQNLDLG